MSHPMNDYPADILEKARAIAVQLPHVDVFAPSDLDDIAGVIAQALMEERNRAWEIATDQALQWSLPQKNGRDDGFNACMAVADAIRSGGE